MKMLRDARMAVLEMLQCGARRGHECLLWRRLLRRLVRRLRNALRAWRFKRAYSCRLLRDGPGVRSAGKVLTVEAPKVRRDAKQIAERFRLSGSRPKDRARVFCDVYISLS